MNKTEAANLVMKTLSVSFLAHDSFAKKYDNRFRKNTLLPYITHITDVYKKLSRCGINLSNNKLDIEEVIKVQQLAILHDILEDTTITEEKLASEFGDEILKLVKQVTRKDGNESREQKWEFLNGFLSDDIHHYSVVVKIIDRYVNTMDYFDTDAWYAGYYALQAYPLYIRWKEDKNNWPSEIKIAINNCIHELSVIVKSRYGKNIFDFDFENVKKLVT